MNDEISKSNNNENDKKKILLVKKYNLSMDKQGKIFKQIKTFIHSQKIFELNEKIRLGKLEILKGPRFDKNKNLIPYSYVGSDRYFVTQRREAIKYLSHIFKPGEKQLKNSNKEFSKVKSESDMYSRFLKTFSKLATNNNLNNEKKKIMKPIPKSLKSNLTKQEKILKRFGTYENLEESIENILLKRTKKNKKDLLLKLNDFSNTTTNIKNNDLSANLKNWNFKLRNPKINGLYERKGYFKATSLNEDLYSIINLNKEKQIFVNPFNYFYKNKLNRKITREEFLRSLKLKGINILEKGISNRRKNNRMSENTQITKTNSSFKNLNQNFSFIEKNERNLSQNFEDMVFALDYNLKNKYEKSENVNKFHN